MYIEIYVDKHVYIHIYIYTYICMQMLFSCFCSGLFSHYVFVPGFGVGVGDAETFGSARMVHELFGAS